MALGLVQDKIAGQSSPSAVTRISSFPDTEEVVDAESPSAKPIKFWVSTTIVTAGDCRPVSCIMTVTLSLPIIWSRFWGVSSVADLAFELRRRHVIWSDVHYPARAYPLLDAAFSLYYSRANRLR